MYKKNKAQNTVQKIPYCTLAIIRVWFTRHVCNILYDIFCNFGIFVLCFAVYNKKYISMVQIYVLSTRTQYRTRIIPGIPSSIVNRSTLSLITLRVPVRTYSYVRVPVQYLYSTSTVPGNLNTRILVITAQLMTADGRRPT